MSSESLLKVIAETEPDEIYNLVAQSHVAVSFQQPIYTADINALNFKDFRSNKNS